LRLKIKVSVGTNVLYTAVLTTISEGELFAAMTFNVDRHT
jgi:hypothetical protein